MNEVKSYASSDKRTCKLDLLACTLTDHSETVILGNSGVIVTHILSHTRWSSCGTWLHRHLSDVTRCHVTSVQFKFASPFIILVPDSGHTYQLQLSQYIHFEYYKFSSKLTASLRGKIVVTISINTFWLPCLRNSERLWMHLALSGTRRTCICFQVYIIHICLIILQLFAWG